MGKKKFHVCEVKAERLMDFRRLRHVQCCCHEELFFRLKLSRFELKLLSRFLCTIEMDTCRPKPLFALFSLCLTVYMQKACGFMPQIH